MLIFVLLGKYKNDHLKLGTKYKITSNLGTNLTSSVQIIIPLNLHI